MGLGLSKLNEPEVMCYKNLEVFLNFKESSRDPAGSSAGTYAAQHLIINPGRG